MIPVKVALRGLVLVAAAGLLAGCISLFPKSTPAQLYRFGVTAPPVQEQAGGGAPFGVFQTVTSFDRAAASDRILTVTGNEAAYIKGARWVTSAVTMFDLAVQHAFDADQGPARLVGRGETVKSDYVLKLDVRTFEARYDNGREAAPTVVVELHAALDNTATRVAVGDRSFKAVVTAGDNRVTAIAAAYDAAVAKVIGELVAWVDAKGAG